MDSGQNGNSRVAVSVFPTFQNTGDAPKDQTATHVHLVKSEPSATLKDGKKLPLQDKSVIAKRLAIILAEFLGTFILVFLGCVGCVSGITATKSIPHEQISWTFGLAVMVAVQCVGHISGSHINPMVTLASVIMGYTEAILAPFYLIGQFTGAIIGFGALKLLTPHQFVDIWISPSVKAPGICSPVLNSEINVIQGLAMEFLSSGILILVCCAVWDRKNSDKHDSVAIRFGFTVAVLAMATGPYTGANMNPARSFAPALFNSDWENHWVYWVGPLGASAVVSTVYKFIFQTPKPEEEGLDGIPLN